MEVLTFAVGGVLCAVDTRTLIEIAARVTISALPGAPAHVAGVIRYRGGVVAAIDLALRFRQPPRAPRLGDHLLVVATRQRRVALVVDRALDRIVLDDAERLPPPVALDGIGGVHATAEGVLVLYDVDAVLSLDEGTQLDAALATGGAG